MALPTYQLNSIPTVEEFNAFLRPKFTKKASEEEFPGFLRQLTDDQLSDELPNVKPQWQNFRDELLVTAGSGLSVNYRGGVAYSTTYQPLVIAPGTLALTNNADNFIYVDNSGVVWASTRPPRTAFRMAVATTLNGQITQVLDRRRRFQVAPPFSHLRVLGGNAESGDYDLSGSDTLTGKRTFRSFRLRATALLTITKYLHLEVAEDVVIDAGAVINITQASSGGTGITAVNASIVGGYPGVGPGTSGTDIPSAIYEDFDWFPIGSGAASGFSGTNLSSSSNTVAYCYLATGGAGGGGILIECGGTVTINGSIIAKGGNASLGSSSVSGNTNIVITGAGGGSGGRIKISCPNSVTLGATSVLNVSGGNGCDAVSLGGGGGGGGGGRIIVVSPTVNLIQGYQILLAGGSGGAGTPTTVRGGTAGASYGGQGGIVASVATYQNGSPGNAGVFNIQYRIP